MVDWIPHRLRTHKSQRLFCSAKWDLLAHTRTHTRMHAHTHTHTHTHTQWIHIDRQTDTHTHTHTHTCVEKRLLVMGKTGVVKPGPTTVRQRGLSEHISMTSMWSGNCPVIMGSSLLQKCWTLVSKLGHPHPQYNPSFRRSPSQNWCHWLLEFSVIELP